MGRKRNLQLTRILVRARAGLEEKHREGKTDQLVMEGFLTEGAFALGPEDWVDLPSVE